jgi:hypothetical protein
MDETAHPDEAIDESLLEIDAMRAIAEALKGLSYDARKRVLRWAADRFGVQAPPSISSRPDAQSAERPISASDSAERLGEDLADLYAACQPDTDAEKTLVVSYWLQEVRGVSGIDAQSVNTELKHLGHGVGNITRAFDRLKENRPQLMIQTKKAGTTKQARKTYRVTVEGRHSVDQMKLHGGSAA